MTSPLQKKSYQGQAKIIPLVPRKNYPLKNQCLQEYRLSLFFLSTGEIFKEITSFIQTLTTQPPNNKLFKMGEILMGELVRRISKESSHLKKTLEFLRQNLLKKIGQGKHD